MRLLQRALSVRPRRVDRASWYEDEWIRAAGETGWTIGRRIGSYIELRRDGDVRLVHGPDAGLDRHVNFRLAGSSTLSALAFADAKVPIPKTTEYIATKPQSLISAVKNRPGQLVLKPAADTGGGRGVTVGPATQAHAVLALRDIAAFTRRVVVQDVVNGSVLRVLVLDGTVIDAVDRSPAVVRGDGSSTVRQLIDTENARRRELGSGATGYIPIAADCRVALARGGATLSSTLAAGATVAVSGCSNTGSEQQSQRVDLSAEATDIAVRAAAAVGVRMAGVDLVVDPCTREPLVVLEVNGAPGLHWHVLVDGTPFDAFVAALSLPN